MKILIVDDEQVVADLLSSVLSLHFPEALIRAVYGGEEAIVDAVGERPDAAIFDLDMSGMDGEEAATALRDLFKDAPPQLIALSGNLARLGTVAWVAGEVAVKAGGSGAVGVRHPDALEMIRVAVRVVPA